QQVAPPVGGTAGERTLRCCGRNIADTPNATTSNVAGAATQFPIGPHARTADRGFFPGTQRRPSLWGPRNVLTGWPHPGRGSGADVGVGQDEVANGGLEIVGRRNELAEGPDGRPKRVEFVDR